jgi:Ser/Thr protein kinase RdoA (MazF antagonist)
MSGFSDALPCQLIHRDEDGEHDNVLVDGARLSAVVDFEFAGPDLRVLEVAIPLVYWPIPDDEQGRWAT